MGGETHQAEDGLGRNVTIPVSLALPIVLAAIAGIFIYFTDEGVLPVSQFYGTAAQIIPILMVAFALERRAIEFVSDPQARIYRIQLFLFLLVGELFALLGASGALRDPDHPKAFAAGSVGGQDWSNVIAAGTAAGLVGGFALLTVLAVSGPGWLHLSFRQESSKKASSPEVAELQQRVRVLEDQLESRL
jgi:hypothetical protein